MFYDSDADLSYLQGKKLAIIGFGSQGQAQAQCLRDSGLDVIIGLRPGGRTWSRAEAQGFTVMPIAEAAKEADFIHFLIPDERHGEVYERDVRPHLTAGKTLSFSHGFSVHFSQVVPPPDVDVIMTAPKSPGHLVRRMFEEGNGVPGLIAVYQDASGHARDKALAWARGIGCTRAGVIETTFREETETDLFGEQAVLCGGVSELIRAGYDTLVEAGYSPEMAYFECLHELKLIVDLIYEGGISLMRYSVSDTAQFGDLTRGRRIINDDVRAEMKKILAEVQSGQFAREWILENQAGRPVFNAVTQRDAEHGIEVVGRKLRAMMPWLNQAVVKESQAAD